ncbi:MAG: PH domain-containing protein [Clostridiales bacterium]|nr:PH domain-containing protein [Clostridiales bacterium]
MIDFKNGAMFKLKKDLSVREKDVAALLIPGETVLGSYTALRDYIVFTDKRVISVNVQGVTGKKKDCASMPYSKVSVFSAETSGVFDLDSELEMYFSGVGKIKFEFTGESDIVSIGQAISSYILK